MSNTQVMSGYTDQIANLPEEAFLGSLLFFTINQADVNLENAKRDLTAAGLSTATLRKNLRPIDAFRKAAKEFAHKFPPVNQVRSELMVRPVGDDAEESYFHLVLEHAVYQAGKKRQLFFEKVGELTFTRGTKNRATGEYTGYGVSARRTTNHLPEPLTAVEDQWLTERLVTFEDRFDHLLHYMDSHAVRTFVREYVYARSGTCVKESGGLYFVKQEHADEIGRLAAWVKSIGSEFHTLPLLNLEDQRAMIMEAFEDEIIKEVDRLTAEIAKILKDQGRQIEEKTFDLYSGRAAELTAKVNEYSGMLGDRADRAKLVITGYNQQCMALLPRIRQPKEMTTP